MDQKDYMASYQLSRIPLYYKELYEFQNDLVDLIQNIKFRYVPIRFQNKMQKDLNHMRKDDHLYIPADKTNNYYRVKPADYEQLLEKSLTKRGFVIVLPPIFPCGLPGASVQILSKKTLF